ncbi:MAG: hypothetical protein NVSMB26_06640 [Beijerinckiaceae bacterium]
MNALRSAFASFANNLTLGRFDEPGVNFGPLANRRGLENTKRLVADALDKGAEALASGQQPAQRNRGYFFEPTVLGNVPDQAEIMQTEPFAPVAPIAPFRDLSSARPSAPGAGRLRKILQRGPHPSRASKDAPIHRAIQRSGMMKSRPILGGLHHDTSGYKVSVQTGQKQPLDVTMPPERFLAGGNGPLRDAGLGSTFETRKTSPRARAIHPLSL